MRVLPSFLDQFERFDGHFSVPTTVNLRIGITQLNLVLIEPGFRTIVEGISVMRMRY